MAFCAIILPIMDGYLEPYGIHITEQDVMHFLMLFGVTGGIGAANAVHKRATKAKTVTYYADPDPVSDPKGKPRPVVTVPRDQVRPSATVEEDTDSTVKPSTGRSFDSYLTVNKGRYRASFAEDPERGNVIAYGTKSIYVKVPGARSYVNAMVETNDGKILTFGQSATKDEDNNVETIRVQLTKVGINGLP